MEVAELFTVGDIAVPAGKIFDMAGIDQDHYEAARVEDFEDGNPVDASWLPSPRASPGRLCSQAASRWRSPVKVGNDCTGVGSRSGGTATKCSADTQSMPAACGWSRSRAAAD